MANTVLEVGTGVFVIVAIWIGVLVFGMILVRASGTAKLLVIPLFLLALFLTLGLLFFRRSPETPPPFKEIEIVDTLFIFRYTFLAVVIVFLLVGLLSLFPLHFLEPVYAMPLETH